MRIKKIKYIYIVGVFMLLFQLVCSRGVASPFSSPQPPQTPPATETEEVPEYLQGPTPEAQFTPFQEEKTELVPDPHPYGPDSPLQEPGEWPEEYQATPDSLRNRADSILMTSDSLRRDTLERAPFLDDIIHGKNEDSLVYNLRTKTVYIWEKGDVEYQDMNLKADFMRIDMETKEIFAFGRPDTTANEYIEWDIEGDTIKRHTRPEFVQGGSSYTMDTITYNLDSKKARIKGVATNDGEGYLQGVKVKKMPDNTVNIAHGRFTTCDHEHPHFYVYMTRSKTIPNEKTVFGPSYLVMEDVPIYFLGLPFGFFPMNTDRKSGLVMPEYGEEAIKGFYIRNGGYYVAFNDYIDAALTGGIYTYGSWEGNLDSRYVKRYRYTGNMSARFTKDIMGEKGDADYVNQNNFKLIWNHSQDSKFNPGSTFSASVNYSTSGYSKYGSQTVSDYLNTQTNSSIAYSKSFSNSPFSLSTSFNHSQNSQDTTVSFTFPNVVVNMSRVYPFRRKQQVGKQRWYEKIGMTYTGNVMNTVKVHERDLFTDEMFQKMNNGIQHSIPVSTSATVLKYITLSPSFTYNERWSFRKVDKEWDPIERQIVNADTTYGFYRLYDYKVALSASTKIYGTYQFKKKDALIQAIRHTLTPTISYNYAPDFGKAKYGYYSQVQSDTLGNMSYYSPYESNYYGPPGRSQNSSLSFGLQQTLEMKVRDRTDTTGVRKIKVIDNFSINSGYNFVAEEFQLQNFSMSLRTTLVKNLALTVNATLDPYTFDETLNRRINRFMIRDGKLGRITSANTSFGYSFNSNKRKTNAPAMNDINSGLGYLAQQDDMFGQSQFQELDPETRRQLMTSKYYDFDIPWNLGLSYTFNYNNPGARKVIKQTVSFNGSVNLTPKWGITFNGGYDFQLNKITPGTIALSRDLHCWQMNFSWVPVGFRKSWSFTIAVKASMLKDLKYDRNRSYYDNLYDL